MWVFLREKRWLPCRVKQTLLVETEEEKKKEIKEELYSLSEVFVSMDEIWINLSLHLYVPCFPLPPEFFTNENSFFMLQQLGIRGVTQPSPSPEDFYYILTTLWDDCSNDVVAIHSFPQHLLQAVYCVIAHLKAKVSLENVRIFVPTLEMEERIRDNNNNTDVLMIEGSFMPNKGKIIWKDGGSDITERVGLLRVVEFFYYGSGGGIIREFFHVQPEQLFVDVFGIARVPTYIQHINGKFLFFLFFFCVTNNRFICVFPFSLFCFSLLKLALKLLKKRFKDDHQQALELYDAVIENWSRSYSLNTPNSIPRDGNADMAQHMQFSECFPIYYDDNSDHNDNDGGRKQWSSGERAVFVDDRVTFDESFRNFIVLCMCEHNIVFARLPESIPSNYRCHMLNFLRVHGLKVFRFFFSFFFEFLC